MRPDTGLFLKKPIEIEQDGKFVGVYPCLPPSKFHAPLILPIRLIQKQSYTITVCPKSFTEEIASARTFGFLDQQELMKQLGLAKGGITGKRHRPG